MLFSPREVVRPTGDVLSPTIRQDDLGGRVLRDRDREREGAVSLCCHDDAIVPLGDSYDVAAQVIPGPGTRWIRTRE